MIYIFAGSIHQARILAGYLRLEHNEWKYLQPNDLRGLSGFQTVLFFGNWYERPERNQIEEDILAQQCVGRIIKLIVSDR
jgi:hypothetical protein